MKKLLIFIFLSSLLITGFYLYRNPPCFGLGCTGNYHFKDTATFFAPKSKLKMEVACAGYVPDGADIGSGKGFVKLFSTYNNQDTVYLKTSEDIDTIIYKNQTTSFANPYWSNHNFFDLLDSLGFKQIDKNEINELHQAMTLINYGHKQGFCKGQTKFIEVANTKQTSNE